MTYSCSDFVDTILDALNVPDDAYDPESPSEQADAALAIIDRMQQDNKALLAPLQALVAWGRAHTSPTQPNSPHDLLVKACEAIAQVETSTEPQPDPVYVIGIEGGVVQGMSSNARGTPPNIIVLDWDVEGSDDSDTYVIDPKSGSRAFVIEPWTVHDPAFVAKVVKAIDDKRAGEEEQADG